MKKWLCLLLTLALCMSAVCGALADCTFTEIGKIENARWVYESNLMCVQVGDGFRICDVNGNALTPDTYSGSYFTNQFGFIDAARANGSVNCHGAFDRTGAEVIPYQYAVIEFLSPNWALGVKVVDATADNYDYTDSDDKSKHYLIDTVDVYNLNKRACVGTLQRSDYKEAEDVNGILNVENRGNGVVTSYDADMNALGTVDYIWDTDYAPSEMVAFRENGQYGLKDAAGNVIMKPSFYNIYDFYGDYAVVSTGEKEGLIDRQGNVVIPAEYDDIKRCYYGPYDDKTGDNSYNALGYFAVIKDGKVGFVDAQGNVTCEPKYSEKIMELYGASATYNDMEGKTHLLAADGVDTLLEGYESMYCLDGSSGMLFRVRNANSDIGVIDWHGNEVFECAYDSIEISGDGNYLLVRTDYKSPSVIYQITYDTGAQQAPAAPAAPEAPAAQQGASNARAAITDMLNRGNGEAPAEEPAAQGDAPTATKSGLTDAMVIVGSVITLLEADAEANKLTVTMLLDDVLVLTGDASVQTIITSVKTLIETDAAANAATAVTLLHSIETLL